MKLPIVAYGDPVLRKKAEDIPAEYPELQTLISNMFDTMYNASGVGLAVISESAAASLPATE